MAPRVPHAVGRAEEGVLWRLFVLEKCEKFKKYQQHFVALRNVESFAKRGEGFYEDTIKTRSQLCFDSDQRVDGHFFGISLSTNKVVGLLKVFISSLLTLTIFFFVLLILMWLIDNSDLFNIGNYRNHRWFYSSCSRLWRMSDCQLAKLFFRTWSDVTMPLHPYSLLSLSLSLSLLVLHQHQSINHRKWQTICG